MSDRPAFAALHLGDHTSYVVVVQDHVPRFVRIIPIDIATAAVAGLRAAGGKATAGRRPGRVGNFTLYHRDRLAVRIEGRYRRQQRPGVGMQRPAE